MNWTLLTNSLLVAGASTFLAFGLGFAAALSMGATSRVLRSSLLGFSIAVLALPPFLVTNCWIDLFGAAGRLRSVLPLNIFSPLGAVWVLALMLWPIPALAIHSAWRKLEPMHFEVDAALRGSSLFKSLLWPATRSAALVASAVVFALAFNNFAVPAILQVKVFPAELWVQFNTSLDAGAALQMSWPVLLVPLALLVCLRRAEFLWPRDTQAEIAPALRRQLGSNWLALVGTITALVLVLSLLAPLLQLVAAPRTWSELMPAVRAGVPALLNSICYAALAAAFAVGLGFLLARWRGIGWMWLLFFIPGVLLGIGGLTLFNRPGLEIISRTAALVVLLLVARHLALVHSINRVALGSVDSGLIDSARLDGARGWNLLRSILWPQIAPQLAAAAYIVYVLCLWDVETTLLVLPPGGETLALRVFNLLHYGHNAHVNALCLLLLLLALAPLILFAGVVAVKRRFENGRAASLKQSAGRFAAAAALLLFLVAGCREPSRDAANSFPLRSSVFSHVQIIGSRGTGAGEFNKPRSLALDTNDNLFVVDMTGRVQKFSPDGKFLLSWQMPQTDLGKPKGMCRDREGNIVIVEPHYQRVSHFTPEGRLVAQWGVKGTNVGELTLPRAVAVDTKGSVIVSEYTLVERVQKFSARGDRGIAAWGTSGLRPGEFNRAEGVGVDAADNIYVADSCNHRIQVFSTAGKFLRTYGHAGRGAGELSYPYDIAVDQEGRQYVCEFGNSRIQIFDRDDHSIEMIGEAGGQPGEFEKPWSIALDSKGNLYVADSMNHRVQKLVRTKSSKAQAPSSRETPGAKPQAARGVVGGISACASLALLVPGAWNLVFGPLAQ